MEGVKNLVVGTKVQAEWGMGFERVGNENGI